MSMIFTKRRWFLAGFISFGCLFSQTLIQTNALFALDGMVNHTAVDWEPFKVMQGIKTKKSEHTCLKINENGSEFHIHIPDGPFPWDATVESTINTVISVGFFFGTIMTLTIYDFMDARVLFSMCLAHSGLMSVITPYFADKGGYYPVVVFRFFTGMYTSIMTPLVPTIIQNWFLPTEQYRFNVFAFMGIDLGRLYFALNGEIIKQFGWEFQFIFTGAMGMAFALLFFVFMTEDPISNLFLTQDEKSLLAQAQRREYKPTIGAGGGKKRTFKENVTKYGKDIKMKRNQTVVVPTPWKLMFKTPMTWVAILQYTSAAWTAPVMMMCVKKYLEEIHGYSISEASILVTVPVNVFTITFAYMAGVAGDYAASRGVSALVIRRVACLVCCLSILPFIVTPFLPCHLFDHQATVWVLQAVASLRGVNCLAGYSSFRDLSPTFTRQLFGLTTIFSSFIPGFMVPVLMGAFGTSTIGQWTQIFLVNAAVPLAGNIAYFVFVKTDTADWDPASRDRLAGQKRPVAEEFHVVSGGEKPMSSRMYDRRVREAQQREAQKSAETSRPQDGGSSSGQAAQPATSQASEDKSLPENEVKKEGNSDDQ